MIAMYDYHSEVEGDLSFSAGDVIKVTEELGEWFRGNIGEETGIFPGNYIQILDEEIKVQFLVKYFENLCWNKAVNLRSLGMIQGLRSSLC